MAVTIKIANEAGEIREVTVDPLAELILAPGEVIVFDGTPDQFTFTPVDGAVMVTAPNGTTFSVLGLNGSRIAQPGDAQDVFVLGADSDATNDMALTVTEQLGLVDDQRANNGDDGNGDGDDIDLDQAADNLQDVNTAAGGNDTPPPQGGGGTGGGTENQGGGGNLGGRSDPLSQFGGFNTGPGNEGGGPGPRGGGVDFVPQGGGDEGGDERPDPVVTVIQPAASEGPPQVTVGGDVEHLFFTDFSDEGGASLALAQILRIAPDAAPACGNGGYLFVDPHASDVIEGDSLEAVSFVGSTGNAGLWQAGWEMYTYQDYLGNPSVGWFRDHTELPLGDLDASKVGLSTTPPYGTPEEGDYMIGSFSGREQPGDREPIDGTLVFEVTADGVQQSHSVDVQITNVGTGLRRVGDGVEVTQEVDGVTGTSGADHITVSTLRPFVDAGGGNDIVTVQGDQRLVSEDNGFGMVVRLDGPNDDSRDDAPLTAIDGGAGNDVLTGLDMTGGSGADIFNVAAHSINGYDVEVRIPQGWYSARTVENPVVIRDFNAGEGDLIGLHSPLNSAFSEFSPGNTDLNQWRVVDGKGNDTLLQTRVKDTIFGQTSFVSDQGSEGGDGGDSGAPTLGYSDWDTVAILENVDASTITDDVLIINHGGGFGQMA